MHANCVPGWYRPRKQGLHAPWPLRSWYLPASQTVQLICPAALYIPEEHNEHDCWAVFPVYWPVGQAKQVADML